MLKKGWGVLLILFLSAWKIKKFGSNFLTFQKRPAMYAPIGRVTSGPRRHKKVEKGKRDLGWEI